MAMNPSQLFSSFSQPQALYTLLIWLRFVSCGLLFLLTLAASQWVDSINQLMNWPLLLILSALAFCLNGVALSLRRFIRHTWQIGLCLVLDSLLWFALIAASGGAINPATSYVLVLLAVAALSLPWPQSVFLLVLNGVLYSVLLSSGHDMSSHGHHHHGAPNTMLNLHLQGMWILFLMTASIMMLVIWLLAKRLQDKEQAIARYREETVRNEQLVAMGTLAANLAHELGSPLSTIMILAQDVEGEDGDLLRQQTERCRVALSRLKFTDSGIYQAQALASEQLLKQLQQEMLLLKPLVNFSWQDQLQAPLMVAPLLKQALLALLNNAAEAALKEVRCTISRQINSVQIDIVHDGARIDTELLQQLGHQRVESQKSGLGIGYFLANASIEHCGGTLLVSNLSTGVLTQVSLPLTGVLNVSA